jgi:hypothetical protein
MGLAQVDDAWKETALPAWGVHCIASDCGISGSVPMATAWKTRSAREGRGRCVEHGGRSRAHYQPGSASGSSNPGSAPLG